MIFVLGTLVPTSKATNYKDDMVMIAFKLGFKEP
jgi:hypothetical protein